jgi:DNA-binding NtrC family response regulator/pimeloyl-ACP methyl ester carboxylesterase
MSRLAQLLGDAPPIAALREQIARILARQADSARRQPPVLILGETGTGKGLVASTLHRAGPRASGPFIDVNCAAIPEPLLEAELFGYERGAFTDARQAKAGLLQAAHGGTIFLDEVGLLPLPLQAKLLKAIEEQSVRRLGGTRGEPISAWVVAATSEDLDAAIRARRFREDLYHRLAVVTLRLPPLRERGADVEGLATHFLAQACRDYGLPPKTLSADARAALATYVWPGNVRELANVMERAAVLGEGRIVTADTLALPGNPLVPAPASPVATPAHGDSGAAEERTAIEEALAATGWNISRAAARLGLPRNTLRYRIAAHGLVASPPREAGRRRGGRPPAPGPAPAVPAPTPLATPSPELVTGGPRWEPRRLTLLQAALRCEGVDAFASETSRALEVVVDKVSAFGGTIEELGAATVVAVFGLDTGEDAPPRAAYAAAAIQKALARARADDPTRPEATVALHTDRLLVARVRGALQLDRDAKSHARALLDALSAHAAPGAVVVSGSAGPFLAQRFALEALGPDTAVAGYRLADHDLDRDRAPFVGRESELRLLTERFEQAQAGRGQLVLLAGEAGIGKSRLLRELRRRLGVAGWLEGRALSGGRAMPLHPLVDMIRRAFDVDEADVDATVVARLERGVLALGEDLRPAIPFLRYLLSVDPGDPAVERMAPAARRNETLAAVQRVLVRATERRPQVVVLEDLHWADPATEEWLATLADSLATRRILMILTYRPGWTPPVGERTFHARLALPTLSAAESIRMTRDLLGTEALPEALQALVVGKAEGNPFFVEEVVRSLLEVGAVRRTEVGLLLTRPLDEVRVPDTIADVILARIERLEPTARRLLQVAAVIGKDVPVALLEGVAAVASDPLRATLRQLQAAEFLYEAGGATDAQLTFKHALTHEVAYGCLLEEHRHALHRQVGEAIEARHRDRLAEVAPTLAEHFERGESWSKAASYHLLAAERAKARYAYPTAVRDCGRAIEAAARGGAPAEGRRALVLRGDLSSLLGDMEAANASYDRALETSTDPDERRRIASRRHRPAEITRGSARLAFYEHGSGTDTLLFVNPILYGLATFQPVIELLCQEFRVLTLEPRGTGRSDALPPGYTCADHAADVRAILDAAGAVPCVGVGISRGGNVLAHLACRDPGALRGLVTVGTRRNPGLLYGGEADWVPAFREHLDRGDVEAATRLYSRLIFSEPGTIDLAEQFVRNCVALAPEVVRSFFSRDPSSDITAILGQVRVPTLVTIGEGDIITTLDEARAMSAGMPHAALHVFPGRGHLPVFTAPEDFCTALRRFVGTARAAADPRGVGP